MKSETPEDILKRENVPFTVFMHEKMPTSVEDAARARSQDVKQVIRTILFRKDQNKFLIVLAPGDMQISWSKLRSSVQSRRITTATKEEVFEQTGYYPGTVSPLGLPQDMAIFVESSILMLDEISIGSGTPRESNNSNPPQFIVSTTICNRITAALTYVPGNFSKIVPPNFAQVFLWLLIFLQS